MSMPTRMIVLTVEPDKGSLLLLLRRCVTMPNIEWMNVRIAAITVDRVSMENLQEEEHGGRYRQLRVAR